MSAVHPAMVVGGLLVTVVATVVLAAYSSRIARTTGDFYVAARSVPAWWKANRSSPIPTTLYRKAPPYGFGPGGEKQLRRQTSTQPPSPLVLRAPFSKVNHSPRGSASAGVFSSRNRHRPMKCS